STTVTADMANAKPKRGAIPRRSLRRQRPRSHQAHNNRTRGSTTVDGLLSMAAAPNASTSAYEPRLLSVSNLRKHSTDNKKKKPDWMFFNSVAHATDSTHTGCTAHSAAANHAPGTRKRRSSVHNSTALAACSAMFTA